MKPIRRKPSLALAFLLALTACLGSCSAVGPWAQDEDFDDFGEFDEFGEFEEELAETYDPLIGYNRVMFTFNDKVFTYVWNPIAKGWCYVVPEPARVALDRAYKNLLTPPRFLNALLQLKFMKATTELGRLVVNSTIGIGGLFDPADAWFGWHAPSPEDFGQTLASYGVGAGPPIMLPFLGPSNLRDGFGILPDSFANPIIYIDDGDQSLPIYVGSILNRTSLQIGQYESLKADALDPYTLFRDAYQQNREKKIEE